MNELYRQTILKAIKIKRETEQIDKAEDLPKTFDKVPYKFLNALLDLELPPERRPIWKESESNLDSYPFLFEKGSLSIASLRCLVLIDEYLVCKSIQKPKKRRTMKTSLFYNLFKPLLSKFGLLTPERLTSEWTENQYSAVTGTLSQLVMLGVLGINYDDLMIVKDTDVEYRLDYPAFKEKYKDNVVKYTKLTDRNFCVLTAENLQKMTMKPFRIPIIYLEKRGQYENAISVSNLFELSMFATRGMSPTTFLCKLNEYLDDHYDHVLLVLSDYDPSGERDIPNSLKKRSAILGMPISEVKRIGINRNQIDDKEYQEKRILVLLSKQKWIEEKAIETEEIIDKKTKKKRIYGYGLQMDALGEERLRKIAAEGIQKYLSQELYVEHIKMQQREDFNAWDVIGDIASGIYNTDPFLVDFARQVTGIKNRIDEFKETKEGMTLDILFAVENIEDELRRINDEYYTKIARLTEIADERTEDVNKDIDLFTDKKQKHESRSKEHKYALSERMKKIVKTLVNIDGYDDRKCKRSMIEQAILDRETFTHGLYISKLYPKLTKDLAKGFNHPKACPFCHTVSNYYLTVDGKQVRYCKECETAIVKLSDLLA